MAQSFRDLRVWQEAMQLAVAVCRRTRTFPSFERLEMSSQLRRAAVSVPSNIAEGKGRSNKEFVQYLTRARGSLWEMETQLEIAKELGYITPAEFQQFLRQAQDISKMLCGLMDAFKAAQSPAAQG